MPRSDWRIIAAVGGLVAAIGVYFLVSDLASVSRQIQDEASYRADIYGEDADAYIERRCVRLTLPTSEDCARQADQAARENQRVEYDLAAQQMTAWWTQVMGVAALIGMGLSALGVWLVWTTFRETRDANVIARKAAIDAESDAKSSRDALVLAQRAIIKIVYPRISEFADNDAWGIVFRVVNKGQSNAHKLRIEYSFCQEAVFPEELDYPESISAICPAGIDIQLPEFRLPVPNSFPTYMIGCLSYVTVHEATFETYFCVLINGRPGRNEHGEITDADLRTHPCRFQPADT